MIIFLLTQLGFVINFKKPILILVQQIAFLGLKIDSAEMMKLFLPQRKVEEIVQMSENVKKGTFTLRNLTTLLGKLTSTIQAILPVEIQVSFLQQIQIETMRKSTSLSLLRTKISWRSTHGDNQHVNLKREASFNSSPTHENIFK